MRVSPTLFTYNTLHLVVCHPVYGDAESLEHKPQECQEFDSTVCYYVLKIYN